MIQIEEVRSQIRAAFAEVDYPTEPLADVDDDSPREWVEQEIAPFRGLTWREVPAKTVEKCHGALGCFSPPAFRYFLPAFLLRALDTIKSEASCTSLLILTLRHPIFGVWDPTWENEYVLRQIESLDSNQRESVQAFLHAALTLATSFATRYWAAQAMEYFWGPETGPWAKSRHDFFHAIISYQRPKAPDARRERLIQSIERAFEPTPRPPDEQSALGWDYEVAEIQHDFRGLDWRHLHPDFLSFHSSALSFFSPSAFRYFLPAFLIADVLEVAGNATPIFHLATSLLGAGGTLDAHGCKRVSQFNATERQAIVEYLQFQPEAGCEYDRPEIAEALARYWLRPT
jgi:hypothetical protein